MHGGADGCGLQSICLDLLGAEVDVDVGASERAGDDPAHRSAGKGVEDQVSVARVPPVGDLADDGIEDRCATSACGDAEELRVGADQGLVAAEFGLDAERPPLGCPLAPAACASVKG